MTKRILGVVFIVVAICAIVGGIVYSHTVPAGPFRPAGGPDSLEQDRHSVVCPRCGNTIYIPKQHKKGMHGGPGMPPPAISPEHGPACGGCPNAQPGQVPEGGCPNAQPGQGPACGGCPNAQPGQAPEGGCPNAKPGHGPGNGGPAPMPSHGPGNGAPAPAPAPNGAPVPPPPAGK